MGMREGIVWKMIDGGPLDPVKWEWYRHRVMETVAFTAQWPSQPETSDIDVKLKNMRGYFNSEGQCA